MTARRARAAPFQAGGGATANDGGRIGEHAGASLGPRSQRGARSACLASPVPPLASPAASPVPLAPVRAPVASPAAAHCAAGGGRAERGLDLSKGHNRTKSLGVPWVQLDLPDL